MKYLLFVVLISIPVVAMDYHKGALQRKITPKQKVAHFDKYQAINQQKMEQKPQKSKCRRRAEACGECCLMTTGCIGLLVMGTIITLGPPVGFGVLVWHLEAVKWKAYAQAIESHNQEMIRNKFIDEQMAKAKKG